MKVIGSFLFVFLCILLPLNCESFKILAIFPYNGWSHHIIFSSLVEELATRNNDVTVINYFPVKNMSNLRQISIQEKSENICNVNIQEKLTRVPDSFFVEFSKAYDMTLGFKGMADKNCERLMTNADIRKIITLGEKYDVVIVEQFVTDCGLAVAYLLNAPVVGITAHIMMPWTYSRLGAPNNPAFVPNRLHATRTKPNLWQKIQSTLIKLGMNLYYRHCIQRSSQRIVNKVYPQVPDLELLGNNISLVLVNQYFPLSGSRLHGANVIEVGGMHVKKDHGLNDKELQRFLDNAENDVVYISFGSVAKRFPSVILEEIMAFVNNTKIKFIWKVDNITKNVVPKNLLMRKWLPQPAVLSHPNVKAFVTHSGMLSTIEAMHYGVPVIAVPLFGDQFFNAAAASENGLGVVLDIYKLNKKILGEALHTVLQDGYQTRARELSKIWKDRPISAMDTAVYWIEYVARHEGRVNMRPPTAQLNIFEYLLLDVLLVLSLFIIAIIYTVFKLIQIVFSYKTVTKRFNKKHE